MRESADTNLLSKWDLNVTEIDVLDSTTVTTECFQHYLKEGRPLKIKAGAEKWPALCKWSPEWFSTSYGDYLVPIAVGDRRCVKFTGMSIKNFVDEMDKKKQQMYLRQYNIFDKIPALLNDVKVPMYCPPDRIILPNFWMGTNTLQPLHQDHHNSLDGIANLFVQVFGEKTVILADDYQTPYLYQRRNCRVDSHLSEVDLEALSLHKYPLVERAKFWQTVVSKGDILFIPSRYWHFVKSAGKSISVSFWWRPNKISDLGIRLIKAKDDVREIERLLTEYRGTITDEDLKGFGVENMQGSLHLFGPMRKQFMSLFNKASRMLLE